MAFKAAQQAENPRTQARLFKAIQARIQAEAEADAQAEAEADAEAEAEASKSQAKGSQAAGTKIETPA